MLTMEFCCYHNHRMKNRIYRIFRIDTNNNYFVLFQPEFQWVVCPGYAVYNTFILFMLHQYTESISGNGTFIWNSLSNIIFICWDGLHMIYFYLMQWTWSDTWQLLLFFWEVISKIILLIKITYMTASFVCCEVIIMYNTWSLVFYLILCLIGWLFQYFYLIVFKYLILYCVL